MTGGARPGLSGEPGSACSGLPRPSTRKPKGHLERTPRPSPARRESAGLRLHARTGNLGSVFWSLVRYEARPGRPHRRSLRIAENHARSGTRRAAGACRPRPPHIEDERAGVRPSAHPSRRSSRCVARALGSATLWSLLTAVRGHAPVRALRGGVSRRSSEEAVDLSTRAGDRRPALGQALALLAVPCRPATSDLAADPPKAPGAAQASETPRSRFYLWQATGDPEHLARSQAPPRLPSSSTPPRSTASRC